MDRTLGRLWLAVMAVAVAGAIAACIEPPMNTPIEVDGRRLEPKSAVWGRAHYENDGPWIVDQKYDVTWVFMSELEDPCAVLAQNALCIGGDGGSPVGPRRPEGTTFDLSYNSFAESRTAEVGGTGGLEATLHAVENGELVTLVRASEGTMSPPSSSDERIWSSFQLTFDGGTSMEGSFHATRCEAMDEILRKELYRRPRCP